MLLHTTLSLLSRWFPFFYSYKTSLWCLQDNSMYLLDEPLASLDRPVADSIWVEAIEKRLRDRGCLVVIATHDKRVLSRADEVIMLGNDGRVSAKGFFIECSFFGFEVLRLSLEYILCRNAKGGPWSGSRWTGSGVGRMRRRDRARTYCFAGRRETSE